MLSCIEPFVLHLSKLRFTYSVVTAVFWIRSLLQLDSVHFVPDYRSCEVGQSTNRVIMSSSKQPRCSPADEQALSLLQEAVNDSQREHHLAFLRDLQQKGLLENLVETVQLEPSKQLPLGTMSDGAKRRLHAADSDDESFQQISPVSRTEGYGASSVDMIAAKRLGAVTFPEGVKSMKDWGRTLCELPKVKDMNLSYEELLDLANSGNTEIAKYLGWVKSFKGQSSRTQDFKKFLLAKETLEEQPKTYFPGSHEVRKLKWGSLNWRLFRQHRFAVVFLYLKRSVNAVISCTSDVIAACCSGTLWLERPLKAKGPRVLPRVGRRYSDTYKYIYIYIYTKWSTQWSPRWEIKVEKHQRQTNI